MRDPVADAKCAELREIAVIEDQNEVAGFVTQAFEHVAVATREIPNISRFVIVRLPVPPGTEDRCPDSPLVHKRPLGCRGMPVKFTHAAWLEPHRYPGDALGDRQFVDACLSGCILPDHLCL